MRNYESNTSSRKPLAIASLTLFLIGGAIVAVFYGDQVVAFASGQILGSADTRIQKRLALFEQEYKKAGRSPAELLDVVESTRKIVQLMEREKPASAEVYYYYSLLNYYEILVRVPLNGPSLLRMTGRGYLPDPPEGMNLAPVSISALAQETASLARKSLAIDPKPAFASRVRAALILGELMATGRTDPNLLQTTLAIKKEELTPLTQQTTDWMRWALFAMQGKSLELEQEFTERKMLVDPVDGSKPDPDSLDANEARLLLSHACFNAKDYIRARNYARQGKYNPNTETIWKVDAARLEGEIFLVQSGPIAARPFFEEALKLNGGKDKFLEDRIASLSPTRPVRTQAP